MSTTLSGPGDPPAVEWQSLRTICPLFASLGDLELQALTEASPLIRVAAGDLAISKGEEAKAAFIILEGRLAALVTRVWGEDRILNEIGTGGLVGEIELLNGDHSMIDMRALEDSLLLVLSREIFEGLMESHPEVWQQVSGLARKNTCRLLLSRQLNQLLGGGMETIADPMLRLQAEQDWLNFENEILQDLEKHVDWVTLDRGQILFRQGEQADSAYVLVSGRIRVSIRDENGLSRAVGQLSKGDIAGEIAFITKRIARLRIVPPATGTFHPGQRTIPADHAEHLPDDSRPLQPQCFGQRFSHTESEHCHPVGFVRIPAE